MTQVPGIPYRRHGPTAELRELLDRLDPGDYFDCGRARLHGLDDVLVDEARQRGLTVGDDSFMLVACDLGLIFCRPSISFALTAPWEEVTITRPSGTDPVVLPVRWSRHGELKFTVSRRLGANVFRRWLQLRMQAERRAREPGRFNTARFHMDGGAEITGEPAMGGAPARPSARPPGGRLCDGELALVPKPGSVRAAPPSWVGSAASLAAALVTLTTLILIITVSVGLYRGLTGGAGTEVAHRAAVIGEPTTIDPRRFLAAVDGQGVARQGAGGPEVTSARSELPVSSAGGASRAKSTSSQQLLSISPETGQARGSIVDPAAPSTSVGARRCDSNYGGCVPAVADLPGDLGDVDCPDVDGSGGADGPYFVDGEVVVLGVDVYGLDTDGDGRACEPGQADGSRPDPTPDPTPDSTRDLLPDRSSGGQDGEP